MNPEDRMRDLMRGAAGAERPSEAEWDAFVGRAHRSLVVHRALSVAAVVVVLALGAIGGGAVVNATRTDDNIDTVTSPTETETDGEVVPGPTESASEPAPDATEEPVPERALELWVVDQDGYLVPFYGPVPDTEGIGAATISTLLEDFGGTEVVTGNNEHYTSAIPRGTTLLGLNISDGIATADFSEEFAAPGGSMGERVRLAQVVYTLTQFPTVGAVNFRIEGSPVTEFGSHGLVLDAPQKRKDYEDLRAPIVVDSPVPYEVVDTTFTVMGTANVFEANVSYRILDGDGNEIEYRALDANGNEVDPGFTTATCGSGCRGKFSFTIDLIQDTDFVMLQVFQASAEDGSPMDLVEVPLSIDPSARP
ncbi:MAG: GerMN domain-containing protein [Actinomycetota bacterium]